MMIKHSKPYEKKKQALDEAEMRMRDEMNDATEKTEKGAMKIAAIVGATAVAVGIGYLIYRHYSNKNTDKVDTEEGKKPKEKSKGSSMGGWLSGILITIASYFVGGLVKQKMATKD
jgi:flagellar basal body-associated protein FliL